MSVMLDFVSAKDSSSVAISGHSYCLSCAKTVNETVTTVPVTTVTNPNSTVTNPIVTNTTIKIDNETDSVITGQSFQACISNETSRIGELSVFSVSLTDWAWCDNCEPQTGAYLDLTFNVTNIASRTGAGATSKEEGFRFGSYLMKFPPYYTSGDATVSMPSGYPLISKGATTSYVTIRFERQQESVSNYRYEPLITQVAPKSKEKAPKPKSDPTVPIVLGMAIPMVVLGALAYWCLSMRPKETQEALLTPHYYSGTYASLEESEILGVELEHDQEIARMVPHDNEEEELEQQSRCEGEPFHHHKSGGDSLEAVQVNM